MSDLPKIISANISFIAEPIVLPDLLKEPKDLKPDFSFLSSASGYAEYYTKFEDKEYNFYRDSPKNVSKTKKETNLADSSKPKPANIQDLGFLMPLNKNHTMHSYWKSFRKRFEDAKTDGEHLYELFYLLPLKIDIQIKPLKYNKIHYNTEAYVYLFPFGCCVTCVDLKVSNIPLEDLPNLIHQLKTSASFSRRIPSESKDKKENLGNIKNFTSEISKKINCEVFNNFNNININPTYIHTFIFIEKTNDQLIYTTESHKKAIYSIMEGKTLNNSQYEHARNSIIDKMDYFSDSEIFFFSTKSTFISASYSYQTNKCMRNNYHSFLNVLFAVNKVLSNSVLKLNYENVSAKKVEEFKSCLKRVFLEDEQKIYLKHVFREVAPTIGLENSIKKLEENLPRLL